MARRTFGAYLLRRSLSPFAAAAVVSVSALISAAEPLRKPDDLANFASNSAVRERLSTVFATPWQTSKSDFAVGSDGKIRRPIRPEIGQNDALAGTFDAAIIEIEKESQNKSISKVGATDTCGPSPAAPNEIKRLIAASADRHGVDAGFALAIAFAESRFDRQRNSVKGARGPMQLIPETAARFGVDDICDPAANIDGGVAYLRQLFDEFQNPLLVAAAYNAGESRIRASGGIPPISETLGFVAEVVNYQIAITRTVGRAGRATQDPRVREATTVGSGTKSRPRWVDGVLQF